MTDVNLRIECVECIEDMIEVSQYKDNEFTKLVFLQCPKCKKKISMYVSMYPRCPHGTFGGYKSCMACRPELMKKAEEKRISIIEKDEIDELVKKTKEEYEQGLKEGKWLEYPPRDKEN